jgi:serine/threonine protein kinase
MHALGLLHRDIKPANILFDQANNLYRTDFGIVTWLGEKPGYDGHMMGTLNTVGPSFSHAWELARIELGNRQRGLVKSPTLGRGSLAQSRRTVGERASELFASLSEPRDAGLGFQ